MMVWVDVMLRQACDVDQAARLRGTCRRLAAAEWPLVLKERVLDRELSAGAVASLAANLERPPTRRRALVAALALATKNRLRLAVGLGPVLLPLLEAAVLFKAAPESELELALEVVCRVVSCARLDEETKMSPDQEDDAAQLLVDAGLAYRIATVLERRRGPSRVKALECLRRVFATAVLERAETSRIVAALLRDARSVDAMRALEALAANARDGDSTETTARRLAAPEALGVLAACARHDPGSRLAQGALFVVDCLCDLDGLGRSRERGDDVLTAVVKNLYAPHPSAFLKEWPTCAALALQVICKLAHLGLDEFGLYRDPDVALMLGPAAHVLLRHTAFDLTTATPLYAINALRFLAHNGYAKAILEADPDAEPRLEDVANAALDRSRGDHPHLLQTRLRTLAYRAQALLQALAI